MSNQINFNNFSRLLDLDYSTLEVESELPILCEDYLRACKHANEEITQTYFMELVGMYVLEAKLNTFRLLYTH